MAEKIKQVVEFELSVTGDQSVKSIKTELREAKNEAINMARAFGDNSTQANAAAAKVAHLKDEIEDLGIKIKGVNPDKFQRIATLVGGLGSGFAAAQGAMALFGSKSEDLEKTMMKLQGAMALAMGLQGLKDLSLLFGGLAKTISTTVVAAFTTLKGAIISTGLGALVVALGLVVSEWDNITDAINRTAAASKKSAKDSMDAAGRALQLAKAKGQETFLLEEEFLQKKIKSLQESGAKEDDIENAKFELKLLNASMEKKADDQAKKEFEDRERKAAEAKKISDAKAIQAAKDRADAIAKAQEEATKRILYAAKLEDEDEKRRADRTAEIIKNNNDAALAEEKRLQDEIAKIQAQADKYYEDHLNKKGEAHLRELEKDYTFAKEFGLSTVKLEKEIYQEKIKIWENEFQKRSEYMNTSLDVVKSGLSAIGDLVMAYADESVEGQKRAFDIKKKIDIANTVIDTITGSIKAFNSVLSSGIPAPYSFILAGIAAAAVNASGVAKVEQIKKTHYEAPGMPSGGGFGGVSANVNQSITQQRAIVGNATGATGNQTQSNTVKVIVTETDITRVQNRTKDIQRRAIVH